mgnify:CR=1 FL=1
MMLSSGRERERDHLKLIFLGLSRLFQTNWSAHTPTKQLFFFVSLSLLTNCLTPSSSSSTLAYQVVLCVSLLAKDLCESPQFNNHDVEANDVLNV